MSVPTTLVTIGAVVDDFGLLQGNLAAGARSDDSTPTLSGSLSAALLAGESVAVYGSGVLLGTATVSGQSWSFIPSLPASAGTTYLFTARVISDLGLLGPLSTSRSFILDTAAPTTTAAISAISDNAGFQTGPLSPGASTDDTTPSLSGSLSAALLTGETLRVFNGTRLLGSAAVNNTTRTWTYTPSPALALGLSTFTVAVADAAGNLGPASAPWSLTIGAAPTTTVAITGVSDDVGLIQGALAASARTEDTTPTLSGSLSAPLLDGETVALYSSGVLLGNASVTGQSWAFTPSLPPSVGTTYTITARVVSALGIFGPLSTSRLFTLDTTAPTTSGAITSVRDNVGAVQGLLALGASTDDATPTLGGTMSAALVSGETLRVFNGSTLLGNAVVNATTLTWTYTTTTALPAGPLSLSVAVADAAGNLGPASAPWPLTLGAIPTITATITDVLDNVGIRQGSVAAGTRTEDSTPTLVGTLSAPLLNGERVQIYNGATLLGIASVSGQSWTFTPTLPNADRVTFTFTARVITALDAAGPLSAGWAIILDTVAPTIRSAITGVQDNSGALQGAVAPGASTDDTTPTLNGTLTAVLVTGENLRVFDNGLLVGRATLDRAGTTWTYTPATPLAEGEHVFTVAVADAAGNLGPASAARSFRVDTTAPSLSISSNKPSLVGAETATITFTFSEAPGSSFSASSLAVSGGSLSPLAASADPRVVTAIFTPAANSSGTAVISVAAGAFSDAAGNGNATPTSLELPYTTALPFITAVTITGTDSNLGVGENIFVALSTSEIVNVATSGGTPFFVINVGGVNKNANYLSGSGSQTLVFAYTIADGDSDFVGGITASANALNLNGGAIQDSNGNSLLLGSAAVEAGSNTLIVNAATPTLSSLTYGSSDGNLAAGETINLIASFNKSVSATAGTTLALNSGGSALYSSGNGSNQLTFAYTPAVGQSTPDLATALSAALAGTIQDGSGNAVSATSFNNLNPAGIVAVETTIPTRSTITYGTNDGRLAVGESINLVATVSEIVTVTGTPTLALNSGGLAVYTGGSGSTRLTFAYSPSAGESAVDLSTRATGALGGVGTIRDAAGNSINPSGFDNFNPAGTVAVDGTAPSVSSIVFGNYSATLAYGAPMTLVVTFSESVRVTGIPTITLDNGDTARYVSGTGTGRLTFSYTPAATQSVDALKTALSGALVGSITDLAGNAVIASGFDNVRPYLLVGVGAFATIMDAITYAIPGDILMLNPGTYLEQIIINKPLTLLGPNAGKTGSATNRTTEARIAIPPTASPGTPLISIADGVNGVTLDGLQLDCPDTTLPRFHYLISATQTSNLTIRNNKMYGSEIPVYILGSSNATGLLIERNQINGGPNVNSSFNRGLYIRNTAGVIQDNTITNMSVGIQFMPQANPTPSTIQRNTISAGLVGLYANVQSNGSAPVEWSQNVITIAANDRTGTRSRVNGAFTTPVVFRGIQVSNLGTAGASSPPQMTFSENIINTARVAGTVYNSTELESLWLTSSYGSGDAIFTNNSFTGWTNAVSSFFPTTVDMSANWWGSNVEGTIAAGLASVATGQIDFGPFLLSGTDSDSTTPGFQPDFSALAITPLGGQFGGSGRVQEALNLVAPGGSITLLSGAYSDGAVRVNRANLTIHAEAGVSGVSFLLDAADSLTLSGSGDLAITGNANANTFVANAGSNSFSGLAGADVFRFNASAAGVISATSFDTITDYQGSSGDRLDLEGLPLIPAHTSGIDVSAATTEADTITGAISQGVLSLSGAIANLNTVEEWLSAARIMVTAPQQTAAFALAGDTYIFQENGANDLLIRLQNVSGITGFSSSEGSVSQVWIL